ncbi:Low temperature requirement A [Obelidium mucronatum]|nr:Low temperature requirement A [Obelidium mucronatum]
MPDPVTPSVKTPLLPTHAVSDGAHDDIILHGTRVYRPLVNRDPLEQNRSSTPLELLFDLTLVVAVSITSEQFSKMLLEQGNVQMATFMFFASFSSTWMTWMDFSWFLSAYDPDDALFRFGTLGQILGTLAIGTGLQPSFTLFNFKQELYGFIFLRVFYILFFLGRAAIEDSKNRVYNLRMMFLTTLVQVGWYISFIYLPTEFEWTAGSFVVLMFCEFYFPFLSEVYTPAPARHPIHLGDRYGAFTIIVVGESFLSLSRGVQETNETGLISMEAIKIASGNIVILFIMWWLYFTIPFGSLMAKNPGKLRLCGYFHYVLHSAIAIVASATALTLQTSLSHHEHMLSSETAVQLLAWALSVYLVTLNLVAGMMTGFCRLFVVQLVARIVVCVVVVVIATFGYGVLGMGDALLVMCVPLLVLLGFTIWFTQQHVLSE